MGFDVKRAPLIRDNQVEGAPGAGIKPRDGLHRSFCCLGMGSHQWQFAAAPLTRRGAKTAGSVQGRRQHALGAKRHPTAAGAAVSSANHPRVIGPPARRRIPGAVRPFIPIGGNQHRPFMIRPVQ